MLFSDNTDKLREELREFIPLASSYNCERIFPLLAAAEQNYIVPLVGQGVYERLLGEDACDRGAGMCRKAVANIAMYENFTLLNTQVLPGGFARVTGENTGTLYKYQEAELKGIFRRNGFDELDRIVSYFVGVVERFPEFRESEYYQSGRGEVVPDRMIFSRYYKPTGHVVFRYMQPFIRRAEDLDLSQVVELEKLREGILAGTLTQEERRTVELLRPVIVCLAVAYAIEDRGVNITDAGVWLENRVAGDGLKEKSPAGNEGESVAVAYRRIAGRYLEELQKHLTGGGDVNPLRRDNNGKKTFWV